MRLLFLFTAFLASVSSGVSPWSTEVSNSRASLRGVHNTGEGTVWASGTNGTVVRSEDVGIFWQICSMPADAAKLDFRGVWGWGADSAIAMASGPGEGSRLYRTEDGGAHWREIFRNPDPEGFWDAIAFSGKHDGVLLGDPVDGRFTIFRTSDGGQHWVRDQSPELSAEKGEGVFAASNTSLRMLPSGVILFGTGGPHARVFRYEQRSGWHSVRVPMGAGTNTSGVFSLAFRDALHGVAVGGDYKHPEIGSGTAAWTDDGGLTWRVSPSGAGGYRSAAAWDATAHVWLAVGPDGSDISRDDGRSWTAVDHTGWNAISLPWVVGANGSIATFNRDAVK